MSNHRPQFSAPHRPGMGGGKGGPGATLMRRKVKLKNPKETILRLLAYLVDRRGALCTVSELIAVLFEDDENHKTYFKSIRKDLIDTLMQVDCIDAIIIQHGKLGINKDNVYCSFFDLLDGKVKLNEVYHGEYMTQYSFGEYTNANLYNQKI